MDIMLVLVFIIQSATLICLYFADRGLKFASKSGIKQVKMLTTKKYKSFFVYYRRKEGVITKHAFVCMIALYIIDFVGLVAISIQFTMDAESSLYLFFSTATMDSNPPLAITSCILAVFSVVLLVAATSQPEYKLSFEQKNALSEYIAKELKKLKEEKRKLSSKYVPDDTVVERPISQYRKRVRHPIKVHKLPCINIRSVGSDTTSTDMTACEGGHDLHRKKITVEGDMERSVPAPEGGHDTP